MINVMQALIFFVPQFFKLFRNYPVSGVLPTEHDPHQIHDTFHS